MLKNFEKVISKPDTWVGRISPAQYRRKTYPISRFQAEFLRVPISPKFCERLRFLLQITSSAS